MENSKMTAAVTCVGPIVSDSSKAASSMPKTGAEEKITWLRVAPSF